MKRNCAFAALSHDPRCGHDPRPPDLAFHNDLFKQSLGFFILRIVSQAGSDTAHARLFNTALLHDVEIVPVARRAVQHIRKLCLCPLCPAPAPHPLRPCYSAFFDSPDCFKPLPEFADSVMLFQIRKEYVQSRICSGTVSFPDLFLQLFFFPVRQIIECPLVVSVQSAPGRGIRLHHSHYIVISISVIHLSCPF